MARGNGSTLVFAGDQPGTWWLVHAGRPRFAGRLLSAEEFEADPQWRALVAHGISAPIPVHFTLGGDVLVVTDFIDPVRIAEGVSPQQAILTQPMLDALHACTRAIARIARRDPSFAPLAERAEQFLVGWTVAGRDDDALDLLHATGVQVRVVFADDGSPATELVQPIAADAADGWEPALLDARLQRLAAERAALLRAHGVDRLDGDAGCAIELDAFERAARGSHGLHWSHCEHDGVCYAALRLDRCLCRLAVEIDGRSALGRADQPVPAGDAEAVLSLAPAYGLHAAVHLVAAWRHAWFQDAIEPGVGDPDGEPPLPAYPCEVELLAEGGYHAAIAFAPPDAHGMYRLVVAPHSLHDGNGDSAALLPYECVRVDRRHFHLPVYLR